MSDFEIPEWIKQNVAYGKKVYVLIKDDMYWHSMGLSEQGRSHICGNVIVALPDLGLLNEKRLEELLSEIGLGVTHGMD